MKKIKITLTHNRTTKNTERYDALDEDAVIRSVYIRKAAFDGDAPPEVILTVATP